MAEYQVLARKYRPQTFGEILGQEATVQTLKNAIKFNRLAHAYLFSGSRGTGKTTTARILAKALNCQNQTVDLEPCNECQSCKEITAGNSLDVLEIDGASHRGIEDIRQINDTAGYATSTGGYKIYIIDEVHMLTKEAFNALLKTLEEPPARVLFIFATTEPHKLPPTILSRCQRFHLNRISDDIIMTKLTQIAKDFDLEVEEEPLRMIANLSDGGLRDAESLFDQVMAFHDEKITAETVASVLGVTSKDVFFELDQAGKEGNIAKAFEIVESIFSHGKDLTHFVESLINHFRTILLMKIGGEGASYFSLSKSELAKYAETAKIYKQEQCLTILDMLLEAQQKIRFSPSAKTALEALLMRIIRIHQRIPVEFLVKRLHELEATVSKTKVSVDPTPKPQEIPKAKKKVKAAAPPKPKVEKKVEKAEPVGKQSQSQYDTLLQFAAVELEGTVERK
ncbi:MAG: DNA polymerase III subunit tau [Chlamydiae bacterium]|nr:DNA polymerase III subunit tau [Chlamydiota bacterium]